MSDRRVVAFQLSLLGDDPEPVVGTERAYHPITPKVIRPPDRVGAPTPSPNP